MDDARQSLHSLLNYDASDGNSQHPIIIPPSGFVRNHTRGRVAGPIAGSEATPRSAAYHGGAGGAGRLANGKSVGGYLLGNGVEPASGVSHLPAVPGTFSPHDETYAEETRAVPQSALARGLALAERQLQAVRARAGMLVDTDERGPATQWPATDPLAMHASRRAASRWATRYATHLVIVLVVGALVALGGLKTFTVRGAYGHALQAVEAYTGTDHFEDEHDHEHDEATGGKPAVDSPEFEIALPRTELGGADAAANSVIPQPAGVAKSLSPGKVIKHVVAEGETVESIAARYQLMPETIMGSNGIYDPEAQLESGRELVIPPVDGMYYVAVEGDSVESIAQRFQVEPEAILSYEGNNIKDGVITAGQQVIVPGGMMPPRQEVITYTVKPGDSLRGIAARFGVDVPTLIYSNDIPDPDNLRIGSQLRVLPVPGVEYAVKKGDTIQSIAQKLGVSPQMILDYEPNGLTPESVLQIDQVIVVPGGKPEERVAAELSAAGGTRPEPRARGVVRPPERQPQRSEPPRGEESKPAENKSASKPQPPKKPAPTPQPKPKPTTGNNTPKAGTGKMMWPVRGVITQYFSRRHNGLDIATRAGTPIHAADSGKVIWSGWRTDGLGYCVIIDHLNGLSTVYGHMLRQPPVYVGQYVSKGQVIGYIGSTGRSTGPHVHFMVKVGSGRNYRNPLAYLGR
jgi:murein DD-endopeptidase MepM/ murein hydrolase activator NlpD